MKTFRLHLMSPAKSEWISDVLRFTGRDDAGSFGIMANAARRIAVLAFGLAHYETRDRRLEYLAMPGGVLYFVDNELLIATTHFVRAAGLDEVTEALDRHLRQEEEALRDIRNSLQHLDEQMMKRLYELQRGRE